ncbi:hypothetical protein K439DRAFT_1621902 [Ramaria rubella]|nr:hypothetical protein K439DRAFT_1621902 [Ramaria rubella]
MFFQVELAYINPLPSCSLDAVCFLASTASSPNLEVNYNIQSPSFEHNFLKHDEYDNAGALGLKPSFIGGMHVDPGDNPDFSNNLIVLSDPPPDHHPMVFMLYELCVYIKMGSNIEVKFSGQLLHSGADPIKMPQLNVCARTQLLPSQALQL